MDGDGGRRQRRRNDVKNLAVQLSNFDDNKRVLVPYSPDMERLIKKGYRAQARKFHPDVNPGDKKAEARFKEVQQAYDILSDGEKRALYDRYGRAAFEGMAAGPRPGAD